MLAGVDIQDEREREHQSLGVWTWRHVWLVASPVRSVELKQKRVTRLYRL